MVFDIQPKDSGNSFMLPQAPEDAEFKQTVRDTRLAP